MRETHGVRRSDPRHEPVAGQREEQRARLRAMWSGVAGAWATHAAFVEARGRHVSDRMLALAQPRPGERVLELGCGPGGPGLDAARLVSPGGDVVLSDVAAEMTAIAAARAAELDLPNVATRVLDIERIDEADGSYDLVLCREALMLVPDPVMGASEIRRVLRPGGRAVLTVWGPRVRNPWLGVMFDRAGEALGAAVPPPGVPHPFSLDDAARLRAVLAGAGLAEVAVGEVDTPYRASSASEWWERTCALAGPLAQRLATLPDPIAQSLRMRACEAIGVYATPNGLEIPGVSLIATAVRG
jgi:SAM-dependent methyltransferase